MNPIRQRSARQAASIDRTRNLGLHIRRRRYLGRVAKESITTSDELATAVSQAKGVVIKRLPPGYARGYYPSWYKGM